MNRKPFSTEPGLIYRMKFDRYTLARHYDRQRRSFTQNDYPKFRGLFMILAREENMIQILTKKGIFWMTDYIFSNPVVYDKPPLELINETKLSY